MLLSGAMPDQRVNGAAQYDCRECSDHVDPYIAQRRVSAVHIRLMQFVEACVRKTDRKRSENDPKKK